ncbi:MAG: GNAT family N-acetyltransferase [Alphaproteobacteria bacterium]|nr:GNAT family N-acetyltransferase [Alphaproteobacteria bacterium]
MMDKFFKDFEKHPALYVALMAALASIPLSHFDPDAHLISFLVLGAVLLLTYQLLQLTHWIGDWKLRGLLLLIAIILGFVLSFHPLGNQSVLDIVLLVLFSFVFILKRFNRQIERGEITQPSDILLHKYPDSYRDDLARAKELCVTGTNLRRIFTDYIPCLRDVLQNGGRIMAIIGKPGSDAVKYGALQETGKLTDGLIRAFSGRLESSLHGLKDLTQKAWDRVEVSTVDFPLGFGLDIVDRKSADGIIYVRHYPLDAGVDKPIMVLRPNEPDWFKFYLDQFEKHLSLSQPWPQVIRVPTTLRATETPSAAESHSANEALHAIGALANKIGFTSDASQLQQGFLFPYREDEYRTFIEQAEYFFMLVISGKLVGFVLAHSSSKMNAFPRHEVYDHIAQLASEPSIIVRQICIDPDYRFNQYGRMLYNELFAEASSQYQTALTFIWEQPLNLPSIKFHKKIGWEKKEMYALKNPDGVKTSVGIWRRSLRPQRVLHPN